MACPARERARPANVLPFKVPPHSIEAEQSLLGGLLLDNQAFDRVADLVSRGGLLPRRPPPHLPPHRQADRAEPAGRRGHGVRVDRGERGQGQDRRPGLPRRAGAEHAERAQHPALRGARARALGAAAPGAGRAPSIAESALEPAGKEVGQLLDEAESRDLRDRRDGRARHAGASRRSSRCWRSVFERIDHLYHRDNTSDVTGVPTGFIDLDRDDLRPAAGRPDHRRRPPVDGQDRARAQHRRARRGRQRPAGGDLLAWKWAATQLAMRMLGSIARVDQHKMRTGRLNDEDWAELSDAMGKLHERRSTSTRRRRPERARAARARAPAAPPVRQARPDRHRLPAADVGVARSGENRATEISEISRSLKALAKELRRAGGRAVAAQPRASSSAPTSGR